MYDETHAYVQTSTKNKHRPKLDLQLSLLSRSRLETGISSCFVPNPAIQIAWLYCQSHALCLNRRRISRRSLRNLKASIHLPRSLKADRLPQISYPHSLHILNPVTDEHHTWLSPTAISRPLAAQHPPSLHSRRRHWRPMLVDPLLLRMLEHPTLGLLVAPMR
jgi:hypothetical protein